jgi:uncharacterized metal-binding protein YceD (DUF177 family)
MEKNKNPWSVPVALDDIPETGLHLEIAAPPEIRGELAALAGVRELPKVSAVFDLTARGAGVHVVGQVNARVGQTCVVTLEPIENDLEEGVDLVFAPAPPETERTHAKDIKADEEAPEPLHDGTIDLGAVATEFLLLGIDPYPRKAGAEFAPVKADDRSARPFAALEALKKRLGGS